VVISIIALLTAILLPALTSARESARRMQCTVNLRSWGVVIAAYTNDYDNQVMQSTSIGGSLQNPHPMVVWADNSVPQPGYNNGIPDSQFALNGIGAYMPNTANTTSKLVNPTSIWWCPTNISAGFDTTVYSSGTLNTWNNNGYFHFDYTYYGQVSNWGSSGGGAPFNRYPTEPQLLIDDELEPGKILMTDEFWWHGSTGQFWQYNHGVNGPSAHNPAAPTGVPNSPIPDISGINRLFGDGSVNWKTRDQFDMPMLYGQTWLNLDENTAAWGLGSQVFGIY